MGKKPSYYLYLDELVEDTIKIISIACRIDANKVKIEKVWVSGVEPSPSFIQNVCMWAEFLEDELELKKLSNYKEADATIRIWRIPKPRGFI